VKEGEERKKRKKEIEILRKTNIPLLKNEDEKWCGGPGGETEKVEHILNERRNEEIQGV
jgi:hypothetical protein